MANYSIIGVMSGTSLDGLDLAWCELSFHQSKWKYRIYKAATIPYSPEWKNWLREAHKLTAPELTALNNIYGAFIGKQINNFIKGSPVSPMYIASHGHTVLHEPEKQITFQAGNGHFIAAAAGITTISDFRTMDVALGGQGAPLVPAGDEILFPGYDFCLNLGGFANISFRKNNQRIAFDVCPVNFILNRLSGKLGKPYDKDGETGKSGTVNTRLLETLNALPFYNQPAPKSLAREWMEKNFFPVTDNSDDPAPNILRTLYEHIAVQICRAADMPAKPDTKMLITGGGAHNKFLITLLQKHFPGEIIMPEEKLVNYKEALIFAMLGVLRLREETNCLASVTGAKKDHCCGVIYHPA